MSTRHLIAYALIAAIAAVAFLALWFAVLRERLARDGRRRRFYRKRREAAANPSVRDSPVIKAD